MKSRTSSAVSIKTVAEKAGVSTATVSRIMNGQLDKASATTVALVQSVVAELGYRPTGAGRTLRSGKSRLVVVLAANMANPAMSAIAASTEIALRNAGYVMVLCDTHESPALQDEYLLEMQAQYAHGWVMLGAVDSPVLRSLSASGERIVFVNRRAPEPAQADLGAQRFVGIDDFAAGAEVAQWMAQQGCRNIGLIHAKLDSSATTDRIAGFKQALQHRHIKLPKTSMLTAPGFEHLEIGYRCMQTMLTRAKPEKELPSVFCTSDLIAYGAQRCCAEQGLKVGEDILLAGFDDGPLNPWLAPWLNSVRVPYALYGQAIAEALGASEPSSWILPHQLITRAPAQAS